MKLQNPFSTKTRELFRDAQYSCWICGSNGGGMTELNHIIGRESNNPLNASVLCRECHSHVGHSKEEHVQLLKKTMAYLVNQGYKLSEKDYGFIRKNILLFKEVLNHD
jgi:hypothetical protein